MFFVAHFLNNGKHIVVPKSWILSIDEHWEKFINNSINRNQKFLCFYTENNEAQDEQGRPNCTFVPNFELEVDPVFPMEGCYTVKLIRYKGKKHRSSLTFILLKIHAIFFF